MVTACHTSTQQIMPPLMISGDAPIGLSVNEAEHLQRMQAVLRQQAEAEALERTAMPQASNADMESTNGIASALLSEAKEQEDLTAGEGKKRMPLRQLEKLKTLTANELGAAVQPVRAVASSRFTIRTRTPRTSSSSTPLAPPLTSRSRQLSTADVDSEAIWAHVAQLEDEGKSNTAAELVAAWLQHHHSLQQRVDEASDTSVGGAIPGIIMPVCGESEER